MKLIAIATVALIATGTGAYAAGSAVSISGNVTQTTILNGPYGGDQNATIIAINQRDNAAMMNRPISSDRLGYGIQAPASRHDGR